MIGFPECRHTGRKKKCGCTKAGTQRFKCLECGKRFTASTQTLAGMRIGIDRTAQIISMLCEGLSVRAVARLANVDQKTILELLLLVGERCKVYMENAIVGVAVKDVSVDEPWAFVGMKERTRKILSRPVGSVGDCYCYVGMERNSRLILAWHMGQRTHESGVTFVRKLGRACHKERFRASSDGWRPYRHLIPNIIPQADYGQLIKVFGGVQDTTRCSPGQIIECKLRTIHGNPDEDRINTSHSERFNLSIRMGMRRFTRLTNGFSRSHAHHEAALNAILHALQLLRNARHVGNDTCRRRWLGSRAVDVAEMIERTANYQKPEPPKMNWSALLDTIPDE